jgi:hypothetical protein
VAAAWLAAGPNNATHGSFSPSEDFRMKKFVVTLLVGAFALTVCLGSVQGRPPYAPILAETYKDNAAIVEKSKAADKCTICHDAKDKKIRNEYGKAISKHFPGDEFKKIMADKEAVAKKFKEAVKATEADKHSSGKTFGEVIKAGKLPGEK